MVIVGSALLGTFSSGVVTQLTTGVPNILATYVDTVLGLVGLLVCFMGLRKQ